MPVIPAPVVRRRRPTGAELVGAVPGRHAALTVVWRLVRAGVLVVYGAWPVALVLSTLVLPRTAGVTVMGLVVAVGLVLVLTGRLDGVVEHERARWRGARIRARWGYCMTAAGLGEHSLLPRLRRVELVAHGLVLDVRLAAGQILDDWQKATPALAHLWRVDAVEVLEVVPGRVVLGVQVVDPLEANHPWPE